ncbi:hypothetical protein ONV78_26300 [Hahella sp. CR1]|uniref:hypothetical protein n=1 Tax=Hahella sp. CR1 TaxID=2992807 RepID=UPI0024421EDD|nr:hypothetical protein [Hahella sp. CR1]MDG9671273.1 hypothetical protein [Hahella sp. CR1]
MKIDDYQIALTQGKTLKGNILVDEQYSFEVYGPFGQGYNIRILNFLKKITLNYHWRNGPGATVRTPGGTYEMSDSSIFKAGKKILQIDQNGNFEPISDSYAMALFVLNHYFWNKTGPFKRINT